MECPNLEYLAFPFSKCKFIDRELPIHISCNKCKEQWVDGPPTENNLTPFLIQINDNRPLPNLVTQAVNLGKAITKHIIGGLEIVDDLESRRRMSICGQCPNLEPLENRCKLCGCFIREKARLKTESCPDIPDRWAENLKEGESATSIPLPNQNSSGCGCKNG